MNKGILKHIQVNNQFFCNLKLIIAFYFLKRETKGVQGTSKDVQGMTPKQQKFLRVEGLARQGQTHRN